MTRVSTRTQFRNAIAAYERGDYSGAFGIMETLARRGDPTARFNLGRMYILGRGVSQDDAAAAHWFRLAAEQGHPGAQAGYALMLDTGRGVDQDDAEAVRWFRAAARRGDAGAQFTLGLLHDEAQVATALDDRHGVARDNAEAARWYGLAAAQGHAGACYQLGALHADGDGAFRDPAAAWYWLSLAATGGLEMAAGHRDAVAAAMTPAELAEARRLLAAHDDTGAPRRAPGRAGEDGLDVPGEWRAFEVGNDGRRLE